MASAQSELVPSREYLEQKLENIKKTEPKRPDYWGGYVLVPSYFEFWQGRPSRLHDRIYYQRAEGKWDTGRLSP
jgi:pyridoxamine 5'-phosphate oxidase